MPRIGSLALLALCLLAGTVRAGGRGQNPLDDGPPLPAGAAAIAIDADDGEVLLLKNPRVAVETAYPPGSLIKVLTALLALEEGGVDPAVPFECRGSATVQGLLLRCWDRHGHGPVNLSKALALSCNLYFADLASRLDPGRFRAFLELAGLGRTASTDLPGETPGQIPEQLTQAETALAGSGGAATVLVTPVQVAAWFAALANGGWIPSPRLRSSTPPARRPFSTPAALAMVCRALREGSAYGTSRGFAAATGGFAKTGTAGWEEGYHTSAWTAACFEAQGRHVALVVFVPEGQGGRDALPLAIALAKELQARPPVPPPAVPDLEVTVSLFTLLSPRRLTVSAPGGAIAVAGVGDLRATSALEVRSTAGDTLSGSAAGMPLPVGTTLLRLHGSTGMLRLETKGIAPRLVAGEVEIRTGHGVLSIINRLPLEEYVAGVVEGEIGPQPVALACQAVISRTYALVNRGRHHDDRGCDFCDTTHCQYYTGLPTRPGTRLAVAASAGSILTLAGEPAEVFYHSTCGGHTLPSGLVFGGPTPPHLAGVDDDGLCRASPNADWRWQVDAGKLLATLTPLLGAAVADWQVAARDSGGRVLEILLQGADGGQTTVRAEDFRLAISRRLGWNSLKSTFFTVERQGKEWVFHGHGLGHGVGLCQWGAITMGRRGVSMSEILRHYFPGTKLRPWRELQ